MAKKEKAKAVEEIVEETQEQPVAEEQKVEEPSNPNAVSYTHLTLPTKA